jgi:hypothetical protein
MEQGDQALFEGSVSGKFNTDPPGVLNKKCISISIRKGRPAPGAMTKTTASR